MQSRVRPGTSEDASGLHRCESKLQPKSEIALTTLASNKKARVSSKLSGNVWPMKPAEPVAFSIAQKIPAINRLKGDDDFNAVDGGGNGAVVK